MEHIETHRRLQDQVLVFALKGICSLRKINKLKTWLSFLDVSKAFDTVNREILFLLLWGKGIQDKAWCLTKGLYDKVENTVIFGAFESSWSETRMHSLSHSVFSCTVTNC